MTYPVWLVDLDGTLYRAWPVKIAMACEIMLCGWRAVGWIRVFRQEHERIRGESDPQGRSPYALQLERAAAKLGTNPSQLEQIVAEWMIQRPAKWIRCFARRELIQEIMAFRNDGGRTALVSDYPARAKLEALSIRKLFDVVIANGEAGGPRRIKPWPDGYQAAARILGESPAACLVIGDRPDADGEAARRAGMAFRHIA
jgi:HAD superfamily hydrolase (TIGR01549 family)